MDVRLSHIEPEDVPLPPTLRRFLGVSATAVAAVVFVLVVGIVGYGALIFGWHPIPSTALGCSLHKRFHSFHGPPVKFEELATDIRMGNCGYRNHRGIHLTIQLVELFQ